MLGIGGGKGILGGIPGLDKIQELMNSPLGKLAMQVACPQTAFADVGTQVLNQALS